VELPPPPDDALPNKATSPQGRGRTPTPEKRKLLAILAGVAFYVVFIGVLTLTVVEAGTASEADAISRFAGIVVIVLAVLAWRKADSVGRRPWAWALGTFVSAGAAYISLRVLATEPEPEKTDRLPGEDYDHYLRRVTRNTRD
jgi:lysylphosphatidylglycerol synthetase-like protein (DUF2156 family)